MNEGLEKLGCKEDSDEDEAGVFFGCAIKSIRLPSTLRRIEAQTFEDCENLKHVELPNCVEYIGSDSFKCTEIEEITFPCTLREVGEDVFEDCESLKVVWVEDGCRAEISNMCVSSSVKIGPLAGTMAGNVRVWDLRELKAVVIPDGVTFVGSYLFFGCEIESVEIPASVVEIGVEAFCGCDKLKKVVFKGATGAKKSLLRSKERSQLMVIDTGAFSWCCGLKEV